MDIVGQPSQARSPGLPQLRAITSIAFSGSWMSFCALLCWPWHYFCSCLLAWRSGSSLEARSFTVNGEPGVTAVPSRSSNYEPWCMGRIYLARH